MVTYRLSFNVDVSIERIDADDSVSVSILNLAPESAGPDQTPQTFDEFMRERRTTVTEMSAAGIGGRRTSRCSICLAEGKITHGYNAATHPYHGEEPN